MSGEKRKAPARKAAGKRTRSRTGGRTAGKGAAAPRKRPATTNKAATTKKSATGKKTAGKPGRKDRGEKSIFEYSFLMVLTFLLLAFGVVMVYSASWAQGFFTGPDGMTENPDSYHYLKRELVFAALGLAAMLFMAKVDYRKLRHAAPMLMWVSIGLLGLVFIPGIGIEQNGARSWIGSSAVITFQPSELAKLATVIFIATRLYQKPRLLGSFMKMLGPVLGLPIIALLLITAEPDLGTASILLLTILMMLIVGGVRLRIIGGIFAGMGMLAMVSLMLFEHQRERMASYFDSLLHFWDISFIRSWSLAQDAGFQLVQSLVAMGSGGLLGVGLGESIQKFNYLPEAHTDMILPIIGEELGLVGVMAVVIGFTALAYIGFRIALKCNDRFGKFLAAGITSLLVGQAAINVSAATGILPLTGIPLPLISYGGSSLVVILAAIGILLNISVNKRGRVVTARFKTIEGGNRSRRDGRPSGSRARARGGAQR
ncbi:MAG: putative lipid II flippase FtsW [Thermoleophilia bacterium]